MSSYCAIFVADECRLTGIELASRLGFSVLKESLLDQTVGISDIGEDEVAVAEIGHWHVLFGHASPFLEIDLSEKCRQLCESGQLFFWLSQGTSGGLWFEFYDQSRTVRKWAQVEGQIVEDEGEPLPCETEPLGDHDDPKYDKDLWFLVRLGECLTGISWEEMVGCVVSEHSPKTR